MKVLYIILGIIVVLLIVAAVLPKTCTIQVETTINKPKQAVWDYVRLIKNQENYSVRVMADPNVKMTYSWVDGAVGFVSAWDSQDKNVGKGEQEIKNIVEGESYDVEIRFEKPMKATNYAKTMLESLSDTQTKVTNTFSATSAFPMNIVTFLMIPTLKKDMQKNMDNLKAVVEK